MQPYSLSHLSDGALLRDLAALVARDRDTTAALLAHIAEVDARRLYVPAGYPSMYAYCVGELHLSEDVAFKRIYVARMARRFPAIYVALADGRLHLTALVLLGPFLTQETAAELFSAAEHKSKSEVEELLAQRFPKPDVPTRVEQIAPAFDIPEAPRQVSEHVETGSPQHVLEHAGALPAQHVPEPVGPAPAQHVPEHAETSGGRARVTPLAPERFALQVTIDRSTREKLRYAQELLGHQMPSGDVADVLDRALDALIHRLEAQKFAATPRPRHDRRRAARGKRTIPADVRRAVWKRDGGQCTFVSETGHRCPARTRLEFDHIDPVARGGQATVERMRLRCRAHNQFEAERTFGVEFMKHKRQEARRAAAEAKARAAEAKTRADEAKARAAGAKAHATREARDRASNEAQARAADAARARAAAAAAAQERDVIPWLRQLGFRADEARRAAAHCETIPDASLEQRVRVALVFLGRARTRGVRREAPVYLASAGALSGTPGSP